MPSTKIILLLMFCLLAYRLGYGQPGKIKTEMAAPMSYTQAYAHPKLSAYSLTASIGFNSYSGELSKPTDYHLQPYYKNPSLNIGVHHQWTHYLAGRLQIGWSHLQSNTYENNWNDRSFGTSMLAADVILEHSLFAQRDIENRYRKLNYYGLASLGFRRYKGQTMDDSDQESSYQNSGFALGAGVGLQYNPTPYLGLGLEGIYHCLFTDDLDGTRWANDPNPKNDNYFGYYFIIKYRLVKSFNYRHYLIRIGST